MIAMLTFGEKFSISWIYISSFRITDPFLLRGQQDNIIHERDIY